MAVVEAALLLMEVAYLITSSYWAATKSQSMARPTMAGARFGNSSPRAGG
jgi:hypothetical protein